MTSDLPETTSRWTPEQVRLVSLYGTCEHCGAPRDFIVTERFAGNLHYEMTCTREGCDLNATVSTAALLPS